MSCNNINEFNAGDVVLVPRGQKTRLFEVLDINGDRVIITNDYVQISRNPEDIVMVCRKGNREDIHTEKKTETSEGNNEY